jgi:GNAT superfamily N-acetyltransferase
VFRIRHDGTVSTSIETYDGTAAVLTDELRVLYAAVYAEPPYYDGPADLAEFVAEWPGLVTRSGFRLAVARLGGGGLAGFALGHAVGPASGWWPADHGTDGTGYGIAELGVHPDWRRRGIARRLHEALLAGRTETRVVLWMRPDAAAAAATYLRWGYRLAGPAPDRPQYQVMFLDRDMLHSGPPATGLRPDAGARIMEP